MEPQFSGAYDPWGLQEEIRLLKVAQFEHAERLSQHSERISKLEKRHDDSRIRSLWSSSSPFPAPLSTFSQQPTNTEPENLDAYDQQQTLVLAGLQLDEVDVPRRGASRANSVRFDDSATTNHWIHDSPGTSDYFQVGQRSNNSIGGYAMTERSSSHKSDNRSDGRQSLRSFGGDVFLPFEGEAGIFRPQTQSSDTLDSCLHRSSVPKLEPTPAVIRCWLDAVSSLDPLLYAVVCTGSARSAIEMSLVTHLRLQDRITRTPEGDKVEVPVYLPDAIVQQHSRITAPSKIPRVTVEFMVLPVPLPKSKEEEMIRIFIGSDVIASHMGDILFSQSKIILHVDDGRKVFVPFIRPDAEDSYSDIFIAHSRHYTPVPQDYAIVAGNDSTKAEDSGMALADSRRTQLSVSSPRPIHGSHASVIRGVAAMEPEFATKEHSNVPTALGSHSRGSSRGMKVLRTSKSFSSSSDKINTQSNNNAESSTPGGHARNASLKPTANRGHNRTMSSGDAVHPPQNPKGSLIRTKSSNVVGGATAFHWMAPKSTVAGE